jgi:hypothetical protein
MQKELGTIDVPNPVRPNAIALTARGEGISAPIARDETKGDQAAREARRAAELGW